MRGSEDQQEEVFRYLPLEKRVGAEHPLGKIRAMADRALAELGARFDELYSHTGRPSIPPEQLLRALILQALYTIRSERQLMDQIDGNWRYRWFVGLKLDEAVWDVTVFTKNRERLLAGEVSRRFFQQVTEQARAGGLLEDEHFTVDGSLIEAWASRCSFEKKKDPPAQGTGARGRKMDRNGLIVEACVTEAIKRAEREAGLAMMSAMARRGGPVTLAADRNYQERTFIEGLRGLGVIPLIAEYKESKNWPNWLLPNERAHPRYVTAQKRRRRIERVFSWIKGVAGLQRTRFRGRRRRTGFFVWPQPRITWCE